MMLDCILPHIIWHQYEQPSSPRFSPPLSSKSAVSAEISASIAGASAGLLGLGRSMLQPLFPLLEVPTNRFCWVFFKNMLLIPRMLDGFVLIPCWCMKYWSIKILLFNGSYQDKVADSRWLLFPLPTYLDNLILACLVNAMDFWYK